MSIYDRVKGGKLLLKGVSLEKKKERKKTRSAKDEDQDSLPTDEGKSDGRAQS
jgi:hypothetical protein